jgi:DNA-binding CsgD family transcriptional regulator
MRKAEAVAPFPHMGLLLLDSSMNPIAMNQEAAQILSYPQKPSTPTGLDSFLSNKIRSTLFSHEAGQKVSLVGEFQSGRRLYVCRAYRTEPTANGKRTSQPFVAVLLERGSAGPISLGQVAQKFNLTSREQEVLQYLLQGLTSKEIATRMEISPNTVKAFLRLIMVKMGVSTRSGIVGKAVTAKS